LIKFFETATNLILTSDGRRELEHLAYDLRFRPNGYMFVNSFIRYKETEGKEGWDGFHYPLKLGVGHDNAKILRGYKDEVLEICEANSIKVDTEKCLLSPFTHITLSDVRPDLINFEHPLDDNQRRAIQQWLVHGTGIAHTTVGGGKTATFGGAAAMIRELYPDAKFLYVTPTERLVRQSTKDMRGFLPDWKIGQYGGGKHEKDGNDMVICTVAILARHFATLLQEKWLKQFMAILYDEVHHCGSESSQRVLEAIPAFFRLGASDTMSEKDPMRWHFMHGQFGPVRNVTEAAPLIEIGRMAKPHIYLVEVPAWKNKYKELSNDVRVGTPAFVLVEGEWTKGVYKGPVVTLDAKGKPLMQKKRTLDDNREWITVEEPVTTPGLHLIEVGGEQHEVESRYVLLNRLYDRGVIRFQERNRMIVKWAAHFQRQQKHTLVICTRTLHIFILEAMIKEAVGDDMVRILFSRDSSNQRDECFEWLKKTPGAVLVSSVVKEGVSINEINAGVSRITSGPGSWPISSWAGSTARSARARTGPRSSGWWTISTPRSGAAVPRSSTTWSKSGATDFIIQCKARRRSTRLYNTKEPRALCPPWG
jgi:superfamily II DNA or RNA helicase